jgi:hypothetical protein
MRSDHTAVQDSKHEPISLESLDYSIAPGGSQEPIISPDIQMGIMVVISLFGSG